MSRDNTRQNATPVLSVLLFLLLIVALPAWAEDRMQPIPHIKPRLIVLTDLSNEPDDEESLVRLLVYSDQFDIEGPIATTSTWLRQNPREDIIRRDLAAYAEVRANLLKHAAGYPPVEDLRAVTKTGQTNYGMAAVGQGKSTGGSQRIINAVDRADDRPVWVSIWAAQTHWRRRSGTCTHAVRRPKWTGSLRSCGFIPFPTRMTPDRGCGANFQSCFTWLHLESGQLAGILPRHLDGHLFRTR